MVRSRVTDLDDLGPRFQPPEDPMRKDCRRMVARNDPLMRSERKAVIGFAGDLSGCHPAIYPERLGQPGAESQQCSRPLVSHLIRPGPPARLAELRMTKTCNGVPCPRLSTPRRQPGTELL